MISSDPQWEALCAYTRQMSGRKMPGERELAQHFGISRQRLRILLSRLEAEGLVERRQGSGTYAVATNGESTLHQVALLVDAALKLGDDPFFSLLVERLQWALQAEGIRCVIERITASESRPRFLGDGALTVGLAGASLLARLRPEAPPAVSLLTRPTESPRGRVSLLLTDDEGAGYEAAHLLINEGRQQLLFVGRRDLPASGERAKGSARAATEQPTASLATFDCGLNYRAGLAAGAALAAGQAGTFDGIIAANDWLAAGLRAGLAGASPTLRRLPLVSFDGLPVARDPALGIRSFALPLEAMAADAVAELKRLAQGASPSSPGRTIQYALSAPDTPYFG